tara:strand:+ start:84868 stop:86004 length:1137 start_codon:yes stop_codon:yes gene_type:complete
MFYRFYITLFVFFLSSCASESLIQTKQDINLAKQDASDSDKSPETLLIEYENKLNAFGEDTLSFYAPLNMQQASENITKAKAQLNNSTSSANKSNPKAELISASRYLDKAVSNKQAVKLHLKTADTQFIELQNLQAPILLPLKFTKTKDEFSQLIKLIENGKIQEAIRQEPDLIEDMIKVEIETLKKSFFGKSVEYIHQAQDLNADDYAPASLKTAEQLLQSSLAFIDKSYRDRNTISDMSEETFKAAKKLYFISKEAFAIHTSSNEEVENKIMSAYDFLREIETGLAIKPIEITDYAEQSTQLLQQIVRKEQETKETLASLQAKKEVLKTVVEPISIPKDTIPKDTIPKIIMSKETNKAVLPELFMPNTYSDMHDTE